MSGRRRQRRGVETLQLVLVLPLLVIVTIAALQYAVLVIVQEAATHAATVGAREAAKGADADDVRDVVNEVLSPHQIMTGPNASVVLETFGAAPEQRGLLACGPIAGPPLNTDEVRVTVCVDIASPPLLNCLTMFGIDFTGQRLEISALSPVE